MKETISSQSPECYLTVVANELAQGLLQLTYHVHNHSEADLYLCDQLHTVVEGGSENQQAVCQVLPNLVHVRVTEDGVIVDKAIMDLSFHDGLSALDIPLLTRLKPGQTHEQSIDIPLPLAPYRVHGSRPSPLSSIPMFLRFELGYFVGSGRVQDAVQETSTSAGVAYRIEPFMAKEQRLVTVGPFNDAVAVINGAGNGVKQPVSNEQWTPWA